jgi:hypothetical protein
MLAPGGKNNREGWLQEGRAISYQSITSLFITSEQQNLSYVVVELRNLDVNSLLIK